MQRMLEDDEGDIRRITRNLVLKGASPYTIAQFDAACRYWDIQKSKRKLREEWKKR